MAKDPADFNALFSKPKVIRARTKDALKEIFEDLVSNNSLVKLSEEDLCSPLTKSDQELLAIVHLSNLFPSQQLLYKHALSRIKRSKFGYRTYYKLDTGYGKTLLCFLLAMANSLHNKMHVNLVVNSSEELTLRDFSKAVEYVVGKDEFQVKCYSRLGPEKNMTCG